MKKLILIILVLAAVGVGAGAYYMRKGGPEPQVSTLRVTRGDIVEAVGATGTLEAVETVNVGTQVSGVVEELLADYNSIVRKGQVIARLDPSLIQSAIEQREASVIRAQADLERLKVSLADARRKLDQAQKMWDKQLIPRDQLDTAELNVKTLESQIKSSDAGLTQAQADLNTQRTNLSYTVIKAPIDGIVISRPINQGQTVAASMNAPTLFMIAQDLAAMQVLASIDESEIGRIRPGQHVTFRVDAYPADTFIGTVSQVRLQPTTVQNVVTYQTVIAVPNPELKLKPGMTATVNIEIARRNDVLRVPAPALRFRPTSDMFAALNLPVPPEMQRGAVGGRGQGERGGQPGGSTPAPGAAAPTQSAPPQGRPQTAPDQARASRAGSPESRGGGDRPSSAGAPGQQAPSTGSGQERRGGFGGGRGFDPNMSPEERRKRMEERMAAMTPEERARWEERMRERAAGGGAGGERGSGAPAGARPGGRGSNPSAVAGTPGAQRPAQGRNPTGAVASGATTIDALFPAMPPTETRGRVWLWGNKELKSLSVRTGVTDGTWAELLDGSGLQEGTEVVTNIVTGLEQQTRPGQQGTQGNPLMGPQRGGRGQPGGGRR
jgi:HlyD family secretion protein